MVSLSISILLARLLLAGVFGVAGIAKLTDREGVRRMMTGFGVPAGLAAPLGWTVVCSELAVALALLTGPLAAAGAVGAFLLLLAFTGAIVVNLARGRAPECHCFGRLHAAPVGWSTVARNGFLAGAAGFVAVDGPLGVASAVLGLAALAVWAGLGLRQQWRQRLGAAARGFSLRDELGRSWTLDGLLAGQRPVLLIFSHPACPSCNALMPAVARWQRDLTDRVTVAVLSGGTREQHLAKAQEHGVERLLADEGRTIAMAYGVLATPSAILIDSDGTIAAAPAQGAAEILTLVTRVVESPERTRFARRVILGRGALALTALLPMVVSKRGDLRRAAASPNTTGGSGSLCVQRYALCTSAPCVASPTNPNISVCRCIVQDGPSYGLTSCEERAPFGDTLYSTFSLQNITPASTSMSCPAGTPWANCVDMVCTIDPNNPAEAICQCVTVQTENYFTFGGNCDTATCKTVIWSGATDSINLAGPYMSSLQALGMTATLPSNCT